MRITRLYQTLQLLKIPVLFEGILKAKEKAEAGIGAKKLTLCVRREGDFTTVPISQVIGDFRLIWKELKREGGDRHQKH